MKHNAFGDLIPLAIIFKALGVENDLDFIISVGTEDEFQLRLLPTLEECHKLNVFTQKDGLRYVGSRIRTKRAFPTKGKSNAQEAVDVLSSMVPIIFCSQICYL